MLFRLTRRPDAGNARRGAYTGTAHMNRQNLPERAEIALLNVPPDRRNPRICWVFEAARQLLDI